MPAPESTAERAPAWALAAAALGLFTVWANSFVANEYLLTGPAPRFDWLGITTARFLPAAAVCWIYLLGWRRREALSILRQHPVRLLTCATLAVPIYNFCLAFGQQQGMPASIASVTTTLAPLFIMVLASIFLGERPPLLLWVGLSVAALGMAVIASADRSELAWGYSLAVVVAAGAPLCWAGYSVLSKPVAGRLSPLVWSYLSVGLGGLMVVPLLATRAGGQLTALDCTGWGALLYLSWPCTVLGFALWTWLLKHLPATVVGLTVFLNPPLATLSKAILARVLPETFVFAISGREWWGGAIVLAGLAIGLSRRLVSRSP